MLEIMSSRGLDNPSEGPLILANKVVFWLSHIKDVVLERGATHRIMYLENVNHAADEKNHRPRDENQGIKTEDGIEFYK